jgi:DNA-binding transcriptional LysR family regulator
LARAGTQHPRELEDSHHRVVGFLWARTGKPVPYALRNGSEHLQIKGRHVFAVDDGNAYLRRVWPAWACCGCPVHVARASGSGELVPLFEDWQLEPMPLYVAYPPNRHVSLKLRCSLTGSSS